jgi:hypothetical protein
MTHLPVAAAPRPLLARDGISDPIGDWISDWISDWIPGSESRPRLPRSTS